MINSPIILKIHKLKFTCAVIAKTFFPGVEYVPSLEEPKVEEEQDNESISKFEKESPEEIQEKPLDDILKEMKKVRSIFTAGRNGRKTGA
jgi:hypothetical protein